MSEKVGYGSVGSYAAFAMALSVLAWQYSVGKDLYQVRYRSEWEYVQFKDWALENVEDDDLIVALQLNGTAYY